MKPVSFRIIVASALVWAVAAAASAQDRTQLLSSMEVKRLVASGSRTDHERLASHFAALADSYAAAAAQSVPEKPAVDPALGQKLRDELLQRFGQHEADASTTGTGSGEIWQDWNWQDWSNN